MSRLALGIAVLTLIAPAADADAGKHDFTVRLMNWNSVTAEVIKRAVRVANSSLEEAGIHVRWLDCTPDEYGFAPSAQCAASLGPADLQLSIRRKAPRILPAAVLGLATYREDGFPERAAIYVERIRSAALSNGADFEVVLGYVMVHELGHLLLENDSHSSRGVMKSHWSEKDLVASARGALTFSPKQINRIQSNMFDRQIAAAGGRNPIVLARKLGRANQ